MKSKRLGAFRSMSLSALVLTGTVGHAAAAETADQTAARLEALKQQIAEQTRRLQALKRSVAEEEAGLDAVRRALGIEVLAAQRGAGAPGAGDTQQAQATPSTPTPTPVGQAPQRESTLPVVAPIFQQPGVLTPPGKFVFEPSVQYSYSSSNRVALVGYTIIPAILIGLIDISEVKANTFTYTLTGRFGVTNRLEVEAKLPYVYRSDAGVGRAFLQGAATDTAIFNTNGIGVGDIEFTTRYQFNDGGTDRPYYVGSLRFKTRTGKDPFQVETSQSVLGFQGSSLQTELPTGSGFYALQPALTVLYPSDPAVFFGTVSYLQSFKRSNVTRNTDLGPQALGTIAPGGIFGFNFGMGLGLNERSSFSIGYDHSSVGRIQQNGTVLPDSVRVQLGTLLLGYSYRLNSRETLNLTLGAGLTRDTPDMTLTLRVPFSM